ncbi:MAG: GHKL domain-containing protein, partial [Clostridia bacterium]|nr:GHKL domain-containing protein [Clostridia bacterium]
SALTKLYITNYESETMLLVVEIIISKVLYFLISMILVRFAGRNKNINTVRIPPSFYLFPVITSASVIGFWYISLKEEIEYNHQIILAIISVLLFLATVFIFFAFQANAQKENKLLTLQQEKERIDTETAYYEILERQNTNLRIYAHDAKNHLLAIKSLNKDSQIETYISEMINNLEEYSNVSHSGNQILDVVINKYQTECKINNINFIFDIKNNNLHGMDHYDIVGLLSNLLDNAKESAIKSKKRDISLETDFRNNYSIIIVANSCDSEPKFDRNGNLVTTKNNSILHGYGLRSVKRIVKKYNGDFAFDYNSESKTFTATIMLDLTK